MAALTVQAVADTGLGSTTFVAATSGGDTVAGAPRAGGWNAGLIALLVANGSASAITVTVGANPALSVPAAKTAVIPVFSEGVGDPSVAIAYSAVTTVTVAAVELGA